MSGARVRLRGINGELVALLAAWEGDAGEAEGNILWLIY